MSVSLIIKGLTNELKFDYSNSKIPKQRLKEYTVEKQCVFTVGEPGPIEYRFGEVVGNQYVVSPALPIGIDLYFIPTDGKENTFQCQIYVNATTLLKPQREIVYTINSSLSFSIQIFQPTN